MGRRKSVKADNVEELHRNPSQYDNKGPSRDGGGGRSRRESDDSSGYGNSRTDRIRRAPSTKNMSRAPSKSGSSFCRPQRTTESPSHGYKGFHLPNVETQLEPLPAPRGAMSMNNSNAGGYLGTSRSNPYPASDVPHNGGYAANGYNGSSTAYSPNPGSSPLQGNIGGKSASAPLTRRGSQMHMSPNGFAPQPPSLPPTQPNIRSQVPHMNASAPQPPLATPTQQQQHYQQYPPQQQQHHQQYAQSHQSQHQQQQYQPRTQSPQPQPQPLPQINFAQMTQWYNSLPELPYVMSQQGPQAPPPFPFPYPDSAHVQQLQQQYAAMQSANHGDVQDHPAAFPQQYQQQQQQQQPYLTPSPSHAPFAPPPPQQHQQMYPQPQSQPMTPPVASLRPGYGPPGVPVTNPNGVGAVAAAPPAVSPTNGSAGTAPALPRTTSILNRRSSFKKVPGGTLANESTLQPPPVAEPQDTSSTMAPSSGILNRVSSFKKNAGGASPSSAVQAAPASPSPATTAAAPVPPQHSAASVAAKAAPADTQSSGILRRKSFFMMAAAAVPEPEVPPEERAVVLREKFDHREQERQRLEAERVEREAAEQKLHEERLQALREAQTGETSTSMVPSLTSTAAAAAAGNSVVSPVAAASRATSTSPDQKVSRASSYSFNSVTTAKSGRSQGPLPQVQRRPQQQQQQPARPTSPMAEIEEDYYKLEQPASSSTAPTHQVSPGGHSAIPAVTSVAGTADKAKQQHFAGRSTNPNAAATSNGSSNSCSTRVGAPVSAVAPSTVTEANNSAANSVKPQPWHRCPSLVLYEIPLRCKRTTNEKGEDVIDDTNFPVRIHSKTLRVTDAATEIVSEYAHDEFVTHRKGSTNVESKLLDKVKDVVVSGYTASVLSLDTKGLAKPTSAFDSASWMAQQRLVLNVVKDVEKMQSIYARQVSSPGTSSSIEVFVSIALVKRVSAEKAAEWNVAEGAARQRAFEVVDLLQAEPKVVPFRMHNSVLFGSRLGSVEHKVMSSEADFNTAMAGAQSSANVVLGRLADAAAVDPDNAELAKERDSVFEVVTCVVRHRKEGAVALADQLKEAPRDVFGRATADEVNSSDEDDDDAHLFSGFNSHNGPSNCSDLVVSCLTCIGVRNNTSLWAAALERKEEMAPPLLFNTAFGGPAFTVILASIDPTKGESAEALSMQAGMTIKLHRRPTNGSARRLIQSAKYQAGAAQKELDRPTRPSGAEQRELKTNIRKSAAALDSLEKVLTAGG